MNICDNTIPEKSFDVVTMLNVLEHIPDVQAALNSAARRAMRYIVLTVLSKPDNNLARIHLLTKERMTMLFSHVGCTRLQFDAVPGHLFMAATIDRTAQGERSDDQHITRFLLLEIIT